MASPSLLRKAHQSDLYVCARCTFRASRPPITTSKRWIGLKYLAKKEEAEKEWNANAAEIRAGKKKSMLTILEERGLVHQFAGTRKSVDDFLTNNRIGAYVGIDPTASSLHVGHLLPLMSIFWMYVHGYHVVSLLGGATSKIGDPTGRLTTREKQHSTVKTENMVNMHYQMKKLWVNVEAYGRKYGYVWEWAWHRELVNNNAWMNKLPVMEILQVLGPGMRIGAMLARQIVKDKLEKGDGMSFAEFSYPLLQAWDWWHMYHTKGVSMQIGGSDQYGNITAGIDAIKYIHSNTRDPGILKSIKDKKLSEPCGMTVPLLTTSAGAKFGKTAGNAIWLDGEQTSTFDLYGYLLRTPDEDVGKYLKLFTFMSIEDIDALVKEHMESPSQRKAQHKLASEFLELVHGVDEARHTESQHRLIFQGKITSPQLVSPEVAAAADGTAAQINANNRPKATVTLPKSLIYTKSIGRIIYACGLADSASEGHRLVQGEGVYIGGSPDGKKGPMGDAAVTWSTIKAWFPEDTRKFLIDDSLLVFRKGKYNVRIVKVVPDEEYAASGLTYPGMEPDWRPLSHEDLEVVEAVQKKEKRSPTMDELLMARRVRRKTTRRAVDAETSQGTDLEVRAILQGKKGYRRIDLESTDEK